MILADVWYSLDKNVGPHAYRILHSTYNDMYRISASVSFSFDRRLRHWAGVGAVCAGAMVSFAQGKSERSTEYFERLYYEHCVTRMRLLGGSSEFWCSTFCDNTGLSVDHATKHNNTELATVLSKCQIGKLMYSTAIN